MALLIYSMDQPDNPLLDKEFFLKEIDLIQNIINRMANNSFLIKGWTITLVVVSMLLGTNPLHKFLSLIPLVTFWYLDAYFLQLERQYRELYNWVINNRAKTNELQFDLNSKRFASKVESIPGVMLSSTLKWFYGVILILILLIILITP